MKKVLFILFALCFVSSLAFAQDATQPVAATTTTETTTTATTTTTTDAAVIAPVVATTPETIALKGYIIDNRCASANNKDTLGEFVKTHTKQCATLPACMESGYSIYADGKLLAFDKNSNAKVAEFLKNADSKLQVSVTAKQVGDELSLVSIENQK